MSACCVSGCKNRNNPAGRLRFYTLPSGSRPVHVKRRRLWLQAIRRANGGGGGGGERVEWNARVCGDHFISGEASPDPLSPDFVPSVFPAEQRRSPRKMQCGYGRTKWRHRLQAAAANVETEESPAGADEAEVLPPPDLMGTAGRETQPPSTPAASQEGKTPSEEDNTDAETIADKPQTTTPQSNTALKIPAGLPTLDKINPVVLLKPAISPSGGYRCELCSRTFAIISQLVKHKQRHDEERSSPGETSGELAARRDARQDEPPFSCNMCDRVFTTGCNLKRHKLLHVRDGRKCRTCGVLFCRRHTLVPVRPKPRPAAEAAAEAPPEDAPVTEPRESAGAHPQPAEPSQTAELPDDVRSSWTFIPLFAAAPDPAAPPADTDKVQPPASHSEVLSEIPITVLRPYAVTRPPGTNPHYFSNQGTSSQSEPQAWQSPASSRPPRPPQWSELPPPLQMFSPKYLTSALLEVKRNYEYIFSKGVDVKSWRGDKKRGRR